MGDYRMQSSNLNYHVCFNEIVLICSACPSIAGKKETKNKTIPRGNIDESSNSYNKSQQQNGHADSQINFTNPIVETVQSIKEKKVMYIYYIIIVIFLLIAYTCIRDLITRIATFALLPGCWLKITARLDKRPLCMFLSDISYNELQLIDLGDDDHSIPGIFRKGDSDIWLLWFGGNAESLVDMNYQMRSIKTGLDKEPNFVAFAYHDSYALYKEEGLCHYGPEEAIKRNAMVFQSLKKLNFPFDRTILKSWSIGTGFNCHMLKLASENNVKFLGSILETPWPTVQDLLQYSTRKINIFNPLIPIQKGLKEVKPYWTPQEDLMTYLNYLRKGNDESISDQKFKILMITAGSDTVIDPQVQKKFTKKFTDLVTNRTDLQLEVLIRPNWEHTECCIDQQHVANFIKKFESLQTREDIVFKDHKNKKSVINSLEFLRDSI